ncbi:CAP domain-containing protein [Candidatus Leptofilum sp.]|uniref:CAP domain-containing protein n=1 Tax=Candidatus Leptofilum sp. TaxID=3241576 RepID=UPI003B5A8FC6
MKNRITLGVAVWLILAAMLSWYQPSWADEPVILGEPAQGTAVATATSPPAPTNSERPSGSNLLYLPLISNQKLGPEAQVVVDLINDEREKAGCAPLQVNSKLVAAAQGHSEDMAFNDFFSHTGSNGSSPGQRIAAQGYSYSTWGENIAAGYSTAASAVNGWMNSSGHRANILNCNYQETGVGYYYLANDTGNENWNRYWTQVFASP